MVMITIMCFDFVCSAKQLVRGEPNVSYICSRYYRAPELIFGATDYTSSIGRLTPAVTVNTLTLKTLNKLNLSKYIILYVTRDCI